MIESPSLLLFALPLVVSLGCLAAAALIYRSARILVAHSNEQIVHLEKQIAVATQGSIGLGQRLLALEAKLRSVQSKQDELSAGDTFAYGQAMQMFKQGADTATVASNCGFSSSEAELMALVQSQLAKRSRAPHEADA